jgi:hypothetical protein
MFGMARGTALPRAMPNIKFYQFVSCGDTRAQKITFLPNVGTFFLAKKQL